MNGRVAGARAEAATDPGLAAEVEPAIDHARPDVGGLVDAEVGVVVKFVPARALIRSITVWSKCSLLDLAVLVPDLAFEPEHAEIVAADQVGIDARLIFDVAKLGIADVNRGRARVGRIALQTTGPLNATRPSMCCDLGHTAPMSPPK